MEIRADLMHYGLVGFHDFWLRSQLGDERANVADALLENCINNGVNLISVPTHCEKDDSKEYPLGQLDENYPHKLIHDRFEYLSREAERSDMCEVGKKSRALLRIKEKKGKGELIILNSQIVPCKKNKHSDYSNTNRIDTYVLGANDIEIGLPVRSILDNAKKRRFINIARTPLRPNAFCLEDDFSKLEQYYDAQTWEAGLCFPDFFRQLPILGPSFNSVVKSVNPSADGEKVLAVSGGKSPRDVFPHVVLDIDEECMDTDSDFLEQLKSKIKEGEYRNHFRYANPIKTFKTNLTFKAGYDLYNEARGSIKDKDETLGVGNLYSKRFLE